MRDLAVLKPHQDSGELDNLNHHLNFSKHRTTKLLVNFLKIIHQTQTNEPDAHSLGHF